jgi:hypothetical protein
MLMLKGTLFGDRSQELEMRERKPNSVGCVLECVNVLMKVA